MRKLVIMLSAALVSLTIVGCKLDTLSGGNKVSSKTKPPKSKTIKLTLDDGSRKSVKISNPKSDNSKLLYVNQDIANIKKVALVNVFVNENPVRVGGMSQAEKVAMVTSLFGSDSKDSAEISIAGPLAEHIYQQTTASLNRQLGWNFIEPSQVLQSEYIDIDSTISPSERKKFQGAIDDAYNSPLTGNHKQEKIRKAKSKLQQRLKGPNTEKNASYPGKTAFKGINLDNSSYSHTVMGKIARELKVDASMVIFLYLKEHDSGNPFSDAKNYSVSFNLMLVNDLGRVISTSTKFDSNKQLTWKVNSDSDLKLDSTDSAARSLVAFKKTVDKVLNQHSESLANWRSDYQTAFQSIASKTNESSSGPKTTEEEKPYFQLSAKLDKNNNTITLNWNKPGDPKIHGYRAYKTRLNGDWVFFKTLKADQKPTISDSGTPGYKHSFYVEALNEKLKPIGKSNRVSVVVPSTSIAAVYNNKLKQQENQALISWKYPSEGIDDLAGFRIFKNGELLVDENTLGKETSQWTSSPLPAGSNYKFEIMAVTETGLKSEKRYVGVIKLK